MSTGNRKYELKARAEQQAETRRRIVEATVELHEEVGPARTTVAEIARRAGVQRLTVYKHFPLEEELFVACQQRFLADHAPPDFAAILQIPDAGDRLRAALSALYASYRDREQMTSKVIRDRDALPALDALLERTMDAQQSQLIDALAAAFKLRGQRASRVRSVIGVALDFGTWQRLKDDGHSDDTAATIFADLVACAAGRSGG